MNVIQETRREALVQAIRESGLSVSEFSLRYLARDHSTVYRWLSGVSPVPRVVATWLSEYSKKAIRG